MMPVCTPSGVQMAARQIEKIGPRGLIRDVMTLPVRLDRIAHSRMFESMAQQSQLAVVQVGGSTQEAFHAADLLHLAAKVLLQTPNGPPDHPQVI